MKVFVKCFDNFCHCNAALQEGMCDETPFEGLCFPFYIRNWYGIVKLLGIILSPGNSRHFPDAIATDPTLRRPAPYPLFRPNSRSGFASLGGTQTLITDAAGVGSAAQ